MTIISYWSAVSYQRTSRRRVLGLAGAGGLSVIAAACGGNKSSTPAARSLATQPADTTARAVRGGTYQIVGGSPQTFDVLNGFGSDGQYATAGYSRLVKFQAFKHPQRVLTSIEPDAAASWEVSPDGLQWTYKIRPNLKFDPRPPTNGRNLNARDVLYSFERVAAKSVNRNALFNAVTKEAPITAVSAPDDATFVIKLAFPYVPLNAMLTYYRYVVLLPVEAESGFDVRQDMRGSGAWRLKEFIPSSRVELVKNPDWYDAAKVNFDGIVYNNVTETATGVSQFRSGNLWTYDLPAHEVLATKQALPQLNMILKDQFALTNYDFRFSYLPGSPFRDERVRRALSMLIDRDLIIDTFGNVEEYRKAGLDIPTRWHTSVPAGEDAFWLDPKSKEFGENARYFMHSPAEAKQLLQAAGYSSPIEAKFTLSTAYGQPYPDMAEAIKGMWQENRNFVLNTQALDHNSDFTPNYYQNMDKFEGIVMHALASHPEVDDWLYYLYLSGQPRSGHLDGSGQPDKVLDDMLAKQRQEVDYERRVSLVKDIQRYTASKMYLFHSPGDALGYSLAWPWLGNYGVFRSRSGPSGGAISETVPSLWFDQSKKS